MARLVKIFVVDDNGRGCYGQKVKEYQGDTIRTDSNGCASLLLENSNTTIYINGHEAYSGPVSRLDNKETFTTSGGRP